MSQQAVVKRRTRSRAPAETTAAQAEVPSVRRQEILHYLKLFGYNPEHSILQAHVAGSFGGVGRRPKESEAREKATTRYQGRTFTVLGRTHDPSFLKKLIPPRPRRSEVKNEGYLGYLWKEKDENQKPPHELIPLDFVPASLRYPTDWKLLYNTPGYLITMHVPSDFAKYKNELNNRLRRIKGDVDVKKEWKFLGELEEYGYEARRKKALVSP